MKYQRSMMPRSKKGRMGGRGSIIHPPIVQNNDPRLLVNETQCGRTCRERVIGESVNLRENGGGYKSPLKQPMMANP